MLCKITKEEASHLNLLVEQITNLGGPAIMAATVLAAGSTSLSPCLKTSAPVHAIMNQLVLALLQHRHAHGEFEDVKGHKDLRSRPEVFEALIGDMNEIFAVCLRGIDPAHDYLLNLFKTERLPAPPAGEGR
jgi:hypothetical protein